MATSFTAKSDIGKGLQTLLADIDKNIEIFFQDNYSTGSEYFQVLVDGTGYLLATYLGIWIMIEGYKILWGGSKQSMTNFMWEASIKIIFIALAMNAGSWINLVYQAFSGIKEYAEMTFSSGGNVYEKLGMWIGMLGDYYEEVFKDCDWYELVYVFLVIVLAFLGFFIGGVPTMRHFIINTLSFLFLMIAAPLAFYFLIFKVTKNAFSQWLQMVLANIITLVMLYFFVNMIFNYIETNLFSSTEYYKNATKIMLQSIFYGILLNVFCNMAVQFAQQLTQVSLEGIAGSAMGRAMGIAGSTAGLAMGGAMLGKNLAMKGSSAVGSLGSAVANSSTGKFVGGLGKNIAKDLSSMAGSAVKGGASALANTNTGKSVLNSAPAQMAKNMGQSVASEASKTYQKAKDIAGKINDYAKK